MKPKYEISSEQARLWQNYVAAKHALIDAGLIRSYKSTEADLAEWLVAQFHGVELPPSQVNKAFDVATSEMRIQVRSYTKMRGNPNGYIIKGEDRNNNPATGATHYAFVCFQRLIPDAVFLVPEEFVRTFPKQQIYRKDLEQTPYRLAMELHAFTLTQIA